MIFHAEVTLSDSPESGEMWLSILTVIWLVIGPQTILELNGIGASQNLGKAKDTIIQGGHR